MRVKPLSPEILKLAYEHGAFPMANHLGEIEFYQTSRRAIFEKCIMHVSRSLGKRIRQGGYCVTFDKQFEDVVRNCFRPCDNWLTDELAALYVKCYELGFAHSCEITVNGQLVGGVFGVSVGGIFSADSMFHNLTDMSKIALYELLKRIRSLGYIALDAQILNSHTESLGCVEVSSEEYQQLLGRALKMGELWQ